MEGWSFFSLFLFLLLSLSLSFLSFLSSLFFLGFSFSWSLKNVGGGFIREGMKEVG